MESPIAALEGLLLSLFSDHELRAFVAHLEHGLAASLPGPTVPLAQLAFETVQLFVRRGLTGASLFAALRAEMPNRAADIARVAARFGEAPGRAVDIGRVTALSRAEPASQTTSFKWDVFIAYAEQDREWVTMLAENLHGLDLKVFFDEWEIGAGEVVSRGLEQGVLGSRSGILVVSPTAVVNPQVMEAYAMLLQASIERRLRLVPVLYADAEVPPMLATRRWVDLRGKKGEAYLEQVRGLARALRGEAPGPPRLVGPPRTP